MDKKIKKIIEEFFEKMLIFDAQINLERIEDSYEISLEVSEPGVLIGKNGETMRAIEHIIRILVSKKIGEPVHLSLDIAGYKSKRKKEIEEMAIAAADGAVRSGRVQLLIPMNAYERRIVHLTLSKRNDIETESVGEEPNRRVMIKAQKKTLV
jgi:spoIIIJ-associated protein